MKMSCLLTQLTSNHQQLVKRFLLHQLTLYEHRFDLPCVCTHQKGFSEWQEEILLTWEQFAVRTIKDWAPCGYIKVKLLLQSTNWNQWTITKHRDTLCFKSRVIHLQQLFRRICEILTMLCDTNSSESRKWSKHDFSGRKQKWKHPPLQPICIYIYNYYRN